MAPGQLDAVQRDFDRRSAFWRTAYDGASYHEHLLQDRLQRTLDSADGLRPGRMIDIGCGGGQLLEALRTRGWEVVGCDAALRQAASTVERLQQSTVVRADGSRTPFVDAGFALVTALGYLEYAADVDAALVELARLAAPGATILVSSPNWTRLAYWIDPIGVARGRVSPQHEGYRRTYHSARSLRRRLRAAGLVVRTVDGHGLGRYTVAGRQMVSDRRAVAFDRWLARRVPAWISRIAAANLVAVAVKP